MLLTLSCSCSRSHFNHDLIRIEGYIQENPEFAMEELWSMSSDFTNKADNGLFSLLRSMALDKNYIDICSDSIIRPAVLYFSKSDDTYRKFLSYYYLGRVYENSESYDDALLSYLQAEYLIDSTIPDDYISRLYTAKGRVYFRQFAMDKALEEAIKAREYSSRCDNPDFYVRSCLDIITVLDIKQSEIQVTEELLSLKEWIESRSLDFPSDYYYYLFYSKCFDCQVEADSVKRYYTLYCNACEREGTSPDSLLMVDFLVKLNAFKEAKGLFSQISIKTASTTSDSINYYSTAAGLNKGLADLEQYYEANLKCRQLIDRMNNNIFDKDVRFLEERFKHDIQLRHKKKEISILSAFILILLMTTGIVLSVVFVRQKRLKVMVNEAREEYLFMQKAFSSSGEKESNDIRQQLRNRVLVLTPYFQEPPLKPIGRNELRALRRDNNEMLRNIGFIYSLSYPDYVARLVRYGLNAEEIGLCSLYASGFITKELFDIIERSRINEINSRIRMKIGKDVSGHTLPAFLRTLFDSGNP